MTRREALRLGFVGAAFCRGPLKTLAPFHETATSRERFTYYVDAADGDDDNDGRSPSSAKRTIASISSLNLPAGARVGFARGRIWTESLIFSQSGREGNPIVLGAYGSGENPVFDASEKKVWRSEGRHAALWSTSLPREPYALVIRDALGQRVASRPLLRSKGQWFWDARAGRAYVCCGHDSSDVIRVPTRPHAITLNGCSYVTLENLVWKGALLDGLMVQDQTNGIKIDHCVAELCVANGAFFSGLDSPHHCGIVIDSTFRNNGASGLLLNGDFQKFQIANSIFHHNGLTVIETSDRHTWTAGLKLWGNGRFGAGSVVENCVAHHNGSGLDDGRKGLGIWVDQAAGVTIRFCSCYANDSWGIYLEKTRDSVAHHNLVWQCAQKSKYTAGLGAKCSEADNSTSNGLYNNVIYGSGYWGLYVGTYQATGTCRFDRNRVANNIAVGSRLVQFYCDTGADNDGKAGDGNEYFSNCFGVESPGLAKWGGLSMDTYAKLDSAYRALMDNVNGDPGFVDPSKADFHLVKDSPCRRRGAILPGRLGSAMTAKPDLGCY